MCCEAQRGTGQLWVPELAAHWRQLLCLQLTLADSLLRGPLLQLSPTLGSGARAPVQGDRKTHTEREHSQLSQTLRASAPATWDQTSPLRRW